MHTGIGQISEVYLDGSARVDCVPELIPAPGQYLLAHANATDAVLPVPVFLMETARKGFRAAPPRHPSLSLGKRLYLRGPLGHGFALPNSARRVALIALEGSAARLRGLMDLGLKANSEVVLVSNSTIQDLPEAVEVQPLQAAKEVCNWADFVAFDLGRENLAEWENMLVGWEQFPSVGESQVLIHTSMPCGGLAECGVCAVTSRHEWKMACRDGPVFPYADLFR